MGNTWYRHGGKIMEIYKYESTDPKQKSNDLSITFSFEDDTKLSDAEAYVTSLLINAGEEVDITFDMWTTPMKDEE